MADVIARLIAAAEKTAHAADVLSSRFALELARILRETERKLKPLMEDALAGDQTATVRAAAANQLRRDLRRVLAESGFDDLADTATSEGLDEIAARVLQSRAVAGATAATLSADATLKLEALKALHLGDLFDAADDLSHALSRAVVRSVFSTEPIREIVTDLGAVVDKGERTLRTLFDTAVSVYGREVEAVQAGDDPETAFVYLGPVDDQTRDFCLAHVGRVYTRSEIDELDNGQIDNVFLTGGGYACRHSFHEVSQFSELQDLKGTTKRVPEIMDEVRAVRAAKVAA